MGPRSFWQAVGWLSLALQGIAAFMFHGLVLCVGPEGHTAVEWFADADCRRVNTTTMSLDGERCCNCTDAPLLQPFADKRDDLRLVNASPRVTPLLAPRLENPRSCGAAAESPASPGGLTARRNIVLQI
jgi:hypothetical protein